MQARARGASEEAVARDQALKEAQSRISDLEKTIKDLQRAIELKSQTGAQLQAQADATKGKAEPPPAPITKAPEPAATVAKAPEPPKAAEPAKAEPPTAAEPAKAEPPKGVEPAPAEPPKAAEPPKVEPPKAVPKAVPKAAKAPRREAPGFFDDLLSGTPSWAIGGAALVVLGGIAALVAARRRKTTKFEDSIISGTDIKTNTVFGSTGGGVVNTGDNSLASDFSREGLGNIDTDEVDPIAEAEVYLAYGRDAQAEEILKEALKKDPQRQEIYLKLLEIHAQHNKPSAFETVAAELYSVSQGQGEVWQKAVGLGRQLDPNNPMFAESATGAAAAAAAVAAASGVKAAAEEPPVLSEPQIRVEPARAQGSGISPDVAADMGDTGGGLDFKLDEEISISPSSGAKAKPKSPIDILAGAESALEKSAKSATHGVESAAALGRVGEGHVDTSRPPPVVHDMDFTLDASEKPAPQKPAARPEPALAAATATAAPTLARPQAAIDLDKLDLSFDPDKATFEDPDALGARRPVARRGDEARPREGVPGDGRRRGRARNPAGSAARGRRPAEIGSAVAAREARLIAREVVNAGGGADPPPVFFHAHRSRTRVRGRAVQRLAVAARRLAACRMRSSARSRRSPARRRATTAAGRTDAGVHATLQVVHFDTEAARPDTAWVRGVNAHLPAGGRRAVGAPGACGLPCALRRHRAPLHLCSDRLARCARRCSPGAWAGTIGRSTWPRCAKRRAALVGTHDFSAFRAAECQAKSPVKTLSAVAVEADGDLVRFDFSAECLPSSHDPQHRRRAGARRRRQGAAGLDRRAPGRARPHARRADFRRRRPLFDRRRVRCGVGAAGDAAAGSPAVPMRPPGGPEGGYRGAKGRP